MEFVTEPGGLSILEVEQLEGSVRGPGCVMPSSDSGGTGDAMIEDFRSDPRFGDFYRSAAKPPHRPT